MDPNIEKELEKLKPQPMPPAAEAAPVEQPQRQPCKILLVVDMQYDFIDGVLKDKEAQKIVDPIVKLIMSGDYADVVMTRASHGTNYLLTPEGKVVPVEHCMVETKGWCVHDKIITAVRASRKSWEYLNKPTMGFKDWNKCSLNPADEITIVGTRTDTSVISNALILKAMYPTIKLKVYSNCCSGTCVENHEAALHIMRSCGIDVEYYDELDAEE